jgi:hypothetical protein
MGKDRVVTAAMRHPCGSAEGHERNSVTDAAYPYANLVETIGYELVDPGVLKEDRYFDVSVEYAKALLRY